MFVSQVNPLAVARWGCKKADAKGFAKLDSTTGTNARFNCRTALKARKPRRPPTCLAKDVVRHVHGLGHDQNVV
jgi:hypothetical protein